MTSRRDVDALNGAGREVVSLARRDLTRFWAQFTGSNPEAFRDALLVFLPELVGVYGGVAASVAAEWYEEVRAGQVSGGFRARTAPGVAVGAVQGSVRYAAGALFTDAPNDGLRVLSGSVQRFVLAPVRDTIAVNVARDPAKPRFARVPTGAKTCAFCTLMASRGFIYHSERAAGDLGAGVGDDFHDDCNCQVVSDWSADPSIAGYEPGRLEDMYRTARDASGVSDLKGIAAQMREMFPDEFTDGHVSH